MVDSPGSEARTQKTDTRHGRKLGTETCYLCPRVRLMKPVYTIIANKLSLLRPIVIIHNISKPPKQPLLPKLSQKANQFMKRLANTQTLGDCIALILQQHCQQRVAPTLVHLRPVLRILEATQPLEELALMHATFEMHCILLHPVPSSCKIEGIQISLRG
ncbi:hypothetical protein BU23DRAFT_144023 [Bimuria novae-zelandiae CBS 107.79]|uniref:Uncharacterized protein n=1 Tax=Bimuria novae-zelandiae CBS 107.79 TaxID=1447943 RepID=A0A6A5V839_9PLEO|nr:hypothetical protein BU23DRAFT_144023 [Bimuria novae-zelandiae CBS 107.79]